MFADLLQRGRILRRMIGEPIPSGSWCRRLKRMIRTGGLFEVLSQRHEFAKRESPARSDDAQVLVGFRELIRPMANKAVGTFPASIASPNREATSMSSTDLAASIGRAVMASSFFLVSRLPVQLRFRLTTITTTEEVSDDGPAVALFEE